jgi:hypothetical protein
MSLTNLAIRQALPGVRGQVLGLELQVFNFLNALNARWGKQELPTGAELAATSQFPLLSQVGESSGPRAQPIYRFDPLTRRFASENFDSYYQIQLAVRYTF